MCICKLQYISTFTRYYIDFAYFYRNNLDCFVDFEHFSVDIHYFNLNLNFFDPNRFFFYSLVCCRWSVWR